MRTSIAQARDVEMGSTFVIVLWVAFGLVSIALYFGHAMSFELRAADNRVSGLSAEQAIEGAARYVNYLLSTQISYGSNGYLPEQGTYSAEGVAVGDAHFWLIGRDTNNSVGPGQIAFGLVDEASKLNLNAASSNMLAGLLESLPRANPDIVPAILDWRDTNSPGEYQTFYATRSPPYQSKSAPFETVDELRLLYGADMETLAGKDVNRNGILDPNEGDENLNGTFEPGILEYVTVYTREPNTYSNGTPRIDIRALTAGGNFGSLLQSAFDSSRANQIQAGLFPPTPPGPRPGGPNRPGGGVVILTFRSPLELYRRLSAAPINMTADEFGKIANALTVTNGSYIQGRVNINTASAAVIASLPGLDAYPDLGKTLINYRQANPDKLTSIAWIVDAIGSNNSSVLDTLARYDCVTTQSYQFTADVAALGPNGRGYKRVRFVFDTSDGTSRIVYRQDLTHLGWALGKDVRQTWLFAKNTP